MGATLASIAKASAERKRPTSPVADEAGGGADADSGHGKERMGADEPGDPGLEV
jgi:hypothetical protein